MCSVTPLAALQVIPMVRHLVLAAAVVATTAATAGAQTISLKLQNGRVTLITQNAMPAAILAEWARLGQVRIIDGERVPGTPLTLHLENVPEREALDIVLRSAAGYVAAPRPQQVATLSRFDRVMVMPTSPGAASARAAAPLSRSNAGSIVQNTPVQVEEPAPAADVTPSVAVAPDEAQNASSAVEQPASSTNFDYANPQRYFAARQAEQQAAEGAAGGQTAQPAAATGSPNNIFGATRSTPGVLPTPQPAPGQAGAAGGNGNAPVNPYGLPANQQPGSAQAPPMEPDRAKYINPYSPTPPRP
ncbi:MAG TPA: hypothetical protein VMF52_17970 [Steroidobacteraceae bacterium]|nr:hypothetical protein [Steroidobacteraceae bacterium]